MNVQKGRPKNCGTYASASGTTSTFEVYLYDAEVVVYDVAAKVIVGTRTFKGTGSCPASFVSENGQAGKSGGYASSDEIATYAASFTR